MIIGHVHKERLSKQLYHPLKYADLEACVDTPTLPQAYLAVRFSGTPSDHVPTHRTQTGGGAPREAHQLAMLHHHPSPERVSFPGDVPWADKTAPKVIFADVWPVDRALTKRTPQLRNWLAQTMADQVRKLNGQHLFEHRWLLHIALLSETMELEIGTTTWTDLRRNRETIARISLP